MPVYIDRHKGADIPEELRHSLEGDIRTQRVDRFGVVTRGVVLDTTENEMVCVTEAPNEQAVRRHHEAAGVPIGEIHRGDAIL